MLEKWNKAKQAIIEAKDVNELSKIRDMANVYKFALKQAKESIEVVNAAAEIKLRAERKAGEYLKGMEMNKGGNQPIQRNDRLASLNEIGVTLNNSSQWQRIADIPEPRFETFINDCYTDKKEITTTGAYKLSKQIKNNVHFSSESIFWNTPKEIIDLVEQFWGEIDLDPCSNEGVANVPSNDRFTHDGLDQDWHGKVFVNPPYGREINDWIEKSINEYIVKNCDEVLLLVPSRTDTKWFAQLYEFPVLFIDGRLKFGDETNSAPFPSAIFYLGEREERFKEIFKVKGRLYVST